MNILNNRYVIVELIPTSISPDNGDIVQLSALKIDDFKLVDRFDYRLNEDKIKIREFIDMCNYDKKSFIYMDSTMDILEAFRKWIDDLPLLIIDNQYTINFLNKISNTKESVFKYLDIELTDDAIQKIILKYQLEPSNYIVDLLYEAIIRENS